MARRVLVHLPLTVVDLAAIAGGEVLRDLPAYAASPAPGAGPDETEAAEFDALCDAAAASVQRILDTGAPPRRVVAVAEVDPGRLTPSEDAHRIDALHRPELLAVYVDEDAAVPDVQALVTAAASGAAPSDAQYDAVETRLLLWHHPDELDDLAAAGEGR